MRDLTTLTDGDVSVDVFRLPDGRIFEPCSRCWGSGRYSFNGTHDRCYGCSGSGIGKPTTEADALRRARNRAKAADRRAAKAKAEADAAEQAAAAWRAENGELLAAMAEHAEASTFLADLLATAAHQPLTERQVEAARRVVEVERRKADERKARQNLGHIDVPVGERATFTVTVVAARYFAAERFDRSGRYLVTMKTPLGHILKTWSSGGFGREASDALDKGERPTWTVKGTVKEHGEYNGTLETTLTRVSKEN